MPKSIKKAVLLTTAIAIVAAASLVLAIAPALFTPAPAKIQCTSPGGGHPQGGQCNGANQYETPSGNAPPGQNK